MLELSCQAWLWGCCAFWTRRLSLPDHPASCLAQRLPLVACVPAKSVCFFDRKVTRSAVSLVRLASAEGSRPPRFRYFRWITPGDHLVIGAALCWCLRHLACAGTIANTPVLVPPAVNPWSPLTFGGGTCQLAGSWFHAVFAEIPAVYRLTHQAHNSHPHPSAPAGRQRTRRTGVAVCLFAAILTPAAAYFQRISVVSPQTDCSPAQRIGSSGSALAV